MEIQLHQTIMLVLQVTADPADAGGTERLEAMDLTVPVLTLELVKDTQRAILGKLQENEMPAEEDVIVAHLPEGEAAFLITQRALEGQCIAMTRILPGQEADLAAEDTAEGVVEPLILRPLLAVAATALSLSATTPMSDYGYL